MIYTLLRAPQLTRLEATNAANLPADLSLLIGRNTDLLLKLSGTHFLTAQGHDPACIFHLGAGRLERMVALVVDDSTITCVTPHIAATRDVSHQVQRGFMRVSLLLASHDAEFDFVPEGVTNSSGLLGSGYPVSAGTIQLLDFPEIERIKITVPNLATAHGV